MRRTRHGPRDTGAGHVRRPFASAFGAALLLTAQVLPASSSRAASPTKTYRIATGPKGMFYWKLSEALQRELRAMGAGFTLKLEPTDGSIEDVYCLLWRFRMGTPEDCERCSPLGSNSGRIDLAWVQSDVLYYAFEGRSLGPRLESWKQSSCFGRVHGLARKAGHHLRALFSAATEVLYVLVRQPFELRSLADVRKGARVALGPEMSGSFATALILLDALGARPSQGSGSKSDLCRKDVPLGRYLETIRNCFREGAYDVAFYVGPMRDRGVLAIQRQGLATLFSLPAPRATWIAQRLPCVVHVSVASQTHLGRDITAVAVRSVLATTEGAVRDRDAAILVEALRRLGQRGTIEKLGGGPFRAWHYAQAVPKKLLHRATVRYVGHHRLDFLDWELVWNIGLILVTLLLLAVAAVVWSDRIRLAWHRQRSYFLFGAVLFLLAASAVVTWASERHYNDNFSTIPETIWSVAVYLLSGFEDRAPITLYGRLASILVMVSGPLLFAILTAYVAAQRIHSLLEEQSVPRALKGHYVICNWNRRGMDLLRELKRSADLLHEPFLAVVIPGQETRGQVMSLRKTNPEVMGNVYILAGEPVDPEVLLTARIDACRSVVILGGEEEGASFGDGRVLLTVHALSEALKHPRRHARRSSLRVVCDLSQRQALEQLQQVGRQLVREGRSALALEGLVGSEIRITPFSQSARTFGIGRLFEQLTEPTSARRRLSSLLRGRKARTDRSPVGLVPFPVPANLDATAFRELLRALYRARRLDDRSPAWTYLPVGVVTGGDTTTGLGAYGYSYPVVDSTREVLQTGWQLLCLGRLDRRHRVAFARFLAGLTLGPAPKQPPRGEGHG